MAKKIKALRQNWYKNDEVVKNYIENNPLSTAAETSRATGVSVPSILRVAARLGLVLKKCRGCRTKERVAKMKMFLKKHPDATRGEVADALKCNPSMVSKLARIIGVRLKRSQNKHDDAFRSFIKKHPKAHIIDVAEALDMSFIGVRQLAKRLGHAFPSTGSSPRKGLHAPVGAGKRYSQEVKDAVVAYINAGNSLRKASREFCVSFMTVREWKRRADKASGKPFKINKNKRTSSNIQDNLAAEKVFPLDIFEFKAYLEKHPLATASDAAKHFGRSPQYIYSFAYSHGFQFSGGRRIQAFKKFVMENPDSDIDTISGFLECSPATTLMYAKRNRDIIGESVFLRLQQQALTKIAVTK